MCKINIRNPHVEGRWNGSRWDLVPAKMGGKRNMKARNKPTLYMGVLVFLFTGRFNEKNLGKIFWNVLWQIFCKLADVFFTPQAHSRLASDRSLKVRYDRTLANLEGASRCKICDWVTTCCACIVIKRMQRSCDTSLTQIIFGHFLSRWNAAAK